VRDAQVLIGRGEQVPESPAGPVIVCTRNDDLDGVVEATPPERRGGIPLQSVIALYKLLYARTCVPLPHVQSPDHCAYADLVFIQNGMLQSWLDEKGLSDNTQVSCLTILPVLHLLKIYHRHGMQ